MRSKATVQVLIAVVMVITACSYALANSYLVPVDPRCNYRSLVDANCEICETVTNFTRHFPMGKGSAPEIQGIQIIRDNPFEDEYVTVQVLASTSGGASDQLPVTMQRMLGVEVSYSVANGNSWYTNNWDGSKQGSGISADFFTREVLVVKNQGNIMFKQYQGEAKPWAVSPSSAAFAEGDRPAPNRRCPWDAAYCNSADYAYPYNDPCPWGLTCPLYDTYTPNTGSDGGGSAWPMPTCSLEATDGPGACNVPGYPEGGGDILDNFPSLDPKKASWYPVGDYPIPANGYNNVPGEPLVRVNGVPGISCDLYNGVNGPIHPLCATPPPNDVKNAYNEFGVYAYKISPGQGLVRFTQALNATDIVDATFYVADQNIWTAKISLKDLEDLDETINSYSGRFILHAKAYDTCGNLASGGQSPPYPEFPGENNEAYIGVKDFAYDQVPTDTDPMGAIKADDVNTQCFATDTWCPEDGMTRDERLLLGGCADPNCECCYNECAPAVCNYGGPLVPDVSAMCSNIADDGNPPGCGPEFGSNKGMAELTEFKMSHSASNLYIKWETQGDMLWGCYGSWYPIVGCEYSLGEMGSKFNGYAAQIINASSQSTFYLIVIPDIPIYGSLSLFIDVNQLLEDAMGNAYEGVELEQYAESGCQKPSEGDEPVGEPCEDIGCDPGANPSGDCDGDGFVNGTDPCPCEDGGDESEDGCPPEEADGDPLAEYKCSACVTGLSGNKLYVEMGVEDTVGDTDGGSIHAMGMTMSIHNLDMDWLLYYACLNGYNLTALAQDQTPRINYYPYGNRARTAVEMSIDSVAPVTPDPEFLKACLGRCDETNRTDGIDNDGDLSQLEPNFSIDEGYEPTSTQFEIQFKEVVTNQDVFRSNLTDLGGYEIQISRDFDGPYATYYVMCDPSASADCYGLNKSCTPMEHRGQLYDKDCFNDPDSCNCNTDATLCKSFESCSPEGLCCTGGDRGWPESDEPYNGGVFSADNTEVRTRFPNPFDETAPKSGYGFPGETISCVVDVECDPWDYIDNDKDGLIDEGCWSPNCYDDGTQLEPDGQIYFLRVRAFDEPSGFASGSVLSNYSAFTSPTSVTILRNTIPPAIPDVKDTYAMASGQVAKVVWAANIEHDLGGYVIYRCPANPIDSVIKTLDGSLDAYCSDDDNYRRVNKAPLDKLNKYFVDDGAGYYETGLGDGSIAAAFQPTWGAPCTYTNSFGQFIKDDKCNWTEADDLGLDAVAGSVAFGEGDGLPTPKMPGIYPGENNAYEWIDCSDIALNPDGVTNPNPDLYYCGNIEDPTTGWFATTAIMFNSEKVAQHLYDVTTKTNYDPNVHPHVLFHNGLVDGYKYYYKVKAVDAPYLGDGHNTISTTDNCDDGITPYTSGPPPNGCVNPIDDRNCDDKMTTHDWTNGGNCSNVSTKMEITPADTQSPQKPLSVKASVAKTGKSVTLTWQTPVPDRTMDHFNVYRATAEDRQYACVRGGCQGDVKADGCECDSAADCYQADAGNPSDPWNRICQKPVKVCTNPPYYTIDPQTNGCDSSPYALGCECDTDADCNICGRYDMQSICENSGCAWNADTCQSKCSTLSNKTDCNGAACVWNGSACTDYKCDYGIEVCMLDPDNLPATYNFVADRMDNDGDGVIDEETAANGLDDDGDGLVDEDVGFYDGDEMIIGKCPLPAPLYWKDTNWVSQERIISNTFTDHTIETDQTYYYRISIVDNAVFDPFDSSSDDEDPPPPNEGIWSFSVVADTQDSDAPLAPSGYCQNDLNKPMPCVDRMDVTSYESACSEDIDSTNNDLYGEQLSIRWRRVNEADVVGYYVYRAEDRAGTGIEPPSGAFEKVQQSLIPQPYEVATDTICFKDQGIENELDYYYAMTSYDDHGNESFLSEINGPVQAIDSTPPKVPEWGSGGIASDMNANKLTVDWNDRENYASTAIKLSDPSETDFSHFLVYRSDDEDDPPVYPICEAGDLCSNNGTCSADTDCTSGDLCSNGYCCSCNANTCSRDRDCDSGVCQNGLCTCSTDKDCSDEGVCVMGKCCSSATCCSGNLTDSQFLDYMIEKDTKYYYCITSVDNDSNESDFSLEKYGVAVDQVPPTAPTSLNATTLSGERIGLGWNKSSQSDVVCYIPYRSTTTNTGDFTAIPLSGSNITTITNLSNIDIDCIGDGALSYVDDDSLTAGTTYYYKLSALDQNGNESALSPYVSVKASTVDLTAPALPSVYYTLAGPDTGEFGTKGTDGLDNNGNNFIDEGIHPVGKISIFWKRPAEQDIAEYQIYRKSPTKISGCTCDSANDPLGDCDNDEIINATDNCPCTPKSPSTNQFSGYSLIDTVTAASICPSTKTHPVEEQKENVCHYFDKNEIDSYAELCNGTRYWYAAVSVDSDLNTKGLQENKAVAVNLVAEPDETAPDKPEKPVVAVSSQNDSLVIKFKENPTIDDADAVLKQNIDIAGYIIYRDTSIKGTFSTKVAVLSDVENLNYCAEQGMPPCYCDQVDTESACFLDISVEENKRFFYKIAAFDYSGNTSELSDYAFGTAAEDTPAAVTGLTAKPKQNDKYSLYITWDPGSLLNNNDILGFRLMRSNAESATPVTLDPDPDTQEIEILDTSSYTDSGLTQGTTYWYTMITVARNGKTSPDARTCGVPGEDIFPPVPPTGLTATPGNASAILSWQKVNEPDISYNIYRAKSKDSTAFTKVNSSRITAPTFTDKSLANGTMYYYCITAYDETESFDTFGCYSNLTNESSCSSAKAVVPNSSAISTLRINIAVKPGWNLLAMPVIESIPVGGERAIVFDGAPEPVSPDESKILFHKFDSKKSTYKTVDLQMDTISDLSGFGFWYYSDDGSEELQPLAGWIASPEHDIAVESGWNLIGNPFTSELYWHNDNIEISIDGVNFISLSEAEESDLVQGAYIWDAEQQAYEDVSDGDAVSAGQAIFVKFSSPATIRMTAANMD